MANSVPRENVKAKSDNVNLLSSAKAFIAVLNGDDQKYLNSQLYFSTERKPTDLKTGKCSPCVIKFVLERFASKI